jgi:hypothetical protein
MWINVAEYWNYYTTLHKTLPGAVLAGCFLGLFFDYDDGGSTFLWNSGALLLEYTECVSVWLILRAFLFKGLCDMLCTLYTWDLRPCFIHYMGHFSYTFISMCKLNLLWKHFIKDITNTVPLKTLPEFWKPGTFHSCSISLIDRI